eukprot:gb/GECG01014776.1/.p1 GENE.gb/GECG01014776.1/~~gb/GECG01014776.1/.p1  ORF type:complete len:211 (+),score=31.94 gb/GECG01014776.1/:1-633(+)
MALNDRTNQAHKRHADEETDWIFCDEFLPSQSSEGNAVSRSASVSPAPKLTMVSGRVPTEEENRGDNAKSTDDSRKQREPTMKDHGVVGVAKARHFHPPSEVVQSFQREGSRKRIYGRGELWVSACDDRIWKGLTCGSESAIQQEGLNSVNEKHSSMLRSRTADVSSLNKESWNLDTSRSGSKKKPSTTKKKNAIQNNKSMFDYFGPRKG